MDSKQIRALLHDRVCTVTFKKINGELRVMDCTTKLDFVPPSAWPENKIEISEDTVTRAVRAFDVKAQGWRSFLVANVISIT